MGRVIHNRRHLIHTVLGNVWVAYLVVPAVLSFVALWMLILSLALPGSHVLLPDNDTFLALGVRTDLLPHYVLVLISASVLFHLASGFLWRHFINRSWTQALSMQLIPVGVFAFVVSVFSPNFYDLLIAPGSYWYVAASEARADQPIKKLDVAALQSTLKNARRSDVVSHLGQPNADGGTNLFYTLAKRGGSGWALTVTLDALKDRVETVSFYSYD